MRSVVADVGGLDQFYDELLDEDPVIPGPVLRISINDAPRLIDYEHYVALFRADSWRHEKHR